MIEFDIYDGKLSPAFKVGDCCIIEGKTVNVTYGVCADCCFFETGKVCGTAFDCVLNMDVIFTRNAKRRDELNEKDEQTKSVAKEERIYFY